LASNSFPSNTYVANVNIAMMTGVVAQN